MGIKLSRAKPGSIENCNGDRYVMSSGGGRGDTVQSTRRIGLAESFLLFFRGELIEKNGENGRLFVCSLRSWGLLLGESSNKVGAGCRFMFNTTVNFQV